jgi:hypothetical protein
MESEAEKSRREVELIERGMRERGEWPQDPRDRFADAHFVEEHPNKATREKREA